MLKFMMFALIAAIPAIASASAPQAAGKATDSEEKIVCKKFAETGSLVSTKRECKSKREWDREREDIRANEGANANSCRNSGAGGVC